MIRMRYTVDGTQEDFQFHDEKLDELLKRADEKFLPAWTAEDEIRFRKIMLDDKQRREKGNRRSGNGKLEEA